MKRVIIESPYAGDIEANTAYARECVLDSLRRGEAPLASHLLYPQVLDDAEPHERSLGIDAGHAWLNCCDSIVVYCARGVSRGMWLGILRAQACGVPIELRGLHAQEEQTAKD